MQGTYIRLGALALLLSFGLLACGDDSPTQSGDELSQAEVEVMMEALAMAGGAGFFTGGGFPAAHGTAAQEVSYNETVDCSGGGSVGISGTISVSGQGESISLNWTMTHNSCTETAPSDGSSWTFNGDPSVTLALTGSGGENNFSYQGSQQGGIAWSSGGRSGSCGIDVQYNMSGSAQGSVSVSVSGTVCGRDVSGTFSGSA